jgi:hypothetical protein
MATNNEEAERGTERTGEMMSADDMKQRVDEFGDRLRQLQAQEVEVCKEWLGELERGHEELKTAHDEYIDSCSLS